MTALKFTKERAYDKGFGWLINYTCGNWSITNVGDGWMVLYNKKHIVTTKTLKEAKTNVCGMVAFNEDMK
tara:strand:- start:139 stop:348 length:210 start_codon:yes stop_codon:yes gene_type:complete